MVWSHSHSEIAYTNARMNLQRWSRLQLLNAFAACEEDKGERVDILRALNNPSYLADDVIVDYLMDNILDVNKCDNGGHNFWIDNEGYYTVSTEQEDNNA